MSSNSKELIAKHQQGGVLTALRGDINKVITGSGADNLGLGCWNWIQLQYNNKKIRIITTYQCVKSI